MGESSYPLILWMPPKLLMGDFSFDSQKSEPTPRLGEFQRLVLPPIPFNYDGPGYLFPEERRQKLLYNTV